MVKARIVHDGTGPVKLAVVETPGVKVEVKVRVEVELVVEVVVEVTSKVVEVEKEVLPDELLPFSFKEAFASMDRSLRGAAKPFIVCEPNNCSTIISIETTVSKMKNRCFRLLAICVIFSILARLLATPTDADPSTDFCSIDSLLAA